ncbi:Splicing factor-like protein [Trema orientale]|uniref:Splicing factor-like protein n=1 Tax=Trema orientale TaxID=63057 RepID=A0A2P5EPP3_TREOI|nr:Splicing factor-like protein [Trema orientale]
MGKKKPKDPESTPKSDVVSPATDIFKTLFGDAHAESAAVSIFSDDNPFRRKPQEKVLEASGNPSDGGSESIEVAELKKRKRDKEEKPSFGEASETPLESEKSKREKLQSYNLGDGEDVNKKKQKKKRKRDELEKEYEARKYGVEVDDEEGDDKQRLAGKVGEKRKTLDNPADMLISKEGFDDETKLLRTLFVGNLPLTVKKKALIKEFSQFGEVESVRIRSVPITDTKKPRKGAVITKQFHEAADSVHAYVVFKTEQSAQASLSHNMAVVGGHHIRVDRACPPRKKMKGDEISLYDHKRTVFVGNLPFDVKDEEVYQVFCGINNMESSVEGVRIIRDPNTNLGKGFAYVLFRTREAATSVVKKRNLQLRDRELRLFHAKPDSTPSKRMNPTPAATSSPTKKLRGFETADGSKKVFANASTSYQGLRASKSGVQKKVAKSRRPDKFSSTTKKGVVERKGKRPAVAARKAKAKVMNESGASKQAGIKRKMDSRTPDSSHRNKKVKKFR